MRTGHRLPRPVLAAAMLMTLEGTASAARVIFHYTPVDTSGNTALTPSGGAPGERVAWFGAARQPYFSQSRPTHLVTFQHPYTCRPVTVPLALPEGTPRVEHRRDRIIYNYGTYTVEAHFLPDGSVDVVYNGGLLRPP
jgi:hypothetical protein